MERDTVVKDPEAIWQEEIARLKRVNSEIARQLTRVGDEVEKSKRDLLVTRRMLFEELPSDVSSDDANVEVGQYMQTHWQQSLVFGRADAVRQRLVLLRDRPYFGRVDFREVLPSSPSTGERETEQLYIGLQSLTGADEEELIYDWRAPIANLYYEFEPGPTEYQVGLSTCRGQLEGKRQYIIRSGVLTAWFDSDVAIGDQLLCELLGKSADGPMRSIVATIQREQNRAIRQLDSKVLVVQGVAGSGKTSVALQRAAYLLYKYRGQLTAGQIVILSPNALFADYIAHVLPELGEANVWQTTLQLYVKRSLEEQYEVESPAQWWESFYEAQSEEMRILQSRMRELKGSILFRDAVESFAVYLCVGGLSFTDIRYKEALILTGEEQLHVFLQAQEWTTMTERLNLVREYASTVLRKVEKQRVQQWISHWVKQDSYVGEAEDIRNRSEARAAAEIAEIRELFSGQDALHAHKVYSSWYRNRELFLEHTKGLGISEAERDAMRVSTLGQLEAGIWPRDDIAGYAWFLQRMENDSIRSDIRYVIVDEAQDYTPFELQMVAGLFPRARLTILGDCGQSLDGPERSLLALASEVYDPTSIREVELTKSYRSTTEILSFAYAMARRKHVPEGLSRSGTLPLRTSCAKEDKIAVIDRAIGTLQTAGMQSIAVLTRTLAESRTLYEALKNHRDVHLIQSGEETFQTGVTVMPVFLSKGLEFDAVLIMGLEGWNSLRDRSLLYVACTRALHVLQLYEEQAGSDSTIAKKAGIWDGVPENLYRRASQE